MTDEELQRFVERVQYIRTQENASIREVAELLGVSSTTINKRLREAGIEPKVLKPITEEMLEETERLRRQHVSMKHIAGRLGVARSRLYDHFEAYRARKRST